MRRESFVKSLFAIGAGTIINMIVDFLTTPIITRIVDPDELGQASIWLLYANIAVMVLCLGLDQALVRFFYRSEDVNYKRRLAAECVFLPLTATAIFSGIAFLLIQTGIIAFEFDLFCTILLFCFIFFNMLYRFSSLFVRLTHNNRLYSVLQVMNKSLYVLLAIFLINILQHNGLYSLTVSHVFAALICVSVSLISQRKYIPRRGSGFDLGEMKELLRFGVPFILSMGITTVFHSLDKLSLNHYRTYEEVGIYTSAMTFVSVFNVIQTSFNTVWAPKSIEHYSQVSEDTAFYRTVFDAMSLIMFGFGIALILFKDLFALLLGAKYREAAYIMPFLIFEPIMYTISETTACGINFAKKSSLHIWTATGACLFNFIGNTVLVPVLGCKGAAISTGLAYIVFFVLRTFFGEKCYSVGFKIGRLSVVTLIAIGFAAYNTFFPFNLLSIVFALLCYAVLFICYKDTIKWLWAYAKSHLFPKLINKFRRGDKNV